MPRPVQLDENALTSEQKRIFNDIAAGPRGVVEGPLRIWLQSPAFAERAQELGAFCRYRTSLPNRLSELAILVIGAYWKAGFEWHAHAPIASRAGVSSKIIEAIRVRERPEFDRPDEDVVHAFARELLDDKQVSDATYARAESILGEVALIELVGVLGYYGLICMTINAFEVSAPGAQGKAFLDATAPARS